MARDVRKRAKGRMRTGRGRDREGKAVSPYRRGRSVWRVKRQSPAGDNLKNPIPHTWEENEKYFYDISVVFKDTKIPEFSLRSKHSLDLQLLPAWLTTAHVSLWLASLLVTSSPWQGSHNSGNSNTLGSPTQPRLHL